MKKIKYSIEHNKVFANVIDTRYDLIVNFWGIYTGTSKKDCLEWLKRHKKEIKDAKKNRI